MIWATDKRGQCTYVGPEWIGFTGQHNRDALGSGWLDMVHVDDRDRATLLLLKAVQHATTLTLRYRLRRAGGGWADVVAAASPSRSPFDSSFVGYLGAISEVKDIEKAKCTGAISTMVVPLPSHSMAPTDPLDLTIDCVIQAKAAAQGVADDAVVAALDLALSVLFLRVGSRSSLVH